MENILLAQGALACGPVETEPLKQYMNETMLSRWEKRPLPFAWIAVFAYQWDKDDKSLPRYARGSRDYVAYNKQRLARACSVLTALYPERTFIPRGNGWPLPVVQAARMAGLGMIGLHGMLICPPHGSWVTLGAVFTDMPLKQRTEGGYCPQCGRCIDACPSGAIGWEGDRRFFQKERCISYITQHVPNPTEREKCWLAQSPTAWGCDLCQEACPYNQVEPLHPDANGVQ